MKKLLSRLHSRLGDFWWYTLMIFIAARAADALNVFVGLYLVPKYVDPSELGAVMPLTQFANFLAIPVAVFASTFRQELSGLAVRREFGKMKSLMRGVFIAAAVFLFLAIVISRLILPAFLERIRIVEGSLGIVILAASFVATVAPVYTNALQSLKKFKANAFLHLLGAPARLLTMLVTMPFRALTGYFMGQASPHLLSIGASVFALRRELAVTAEPYWNRALLSRLSRVFTVFAISALAGGLATLVENTVLRQRLPEVESAAFYIVTRFSEIATFLGNALVFTIFPFAAETAARGKDTRPLIAKSAMAVMATNGLLAGLLICFGSQLLSIVPNGTTYASCWWAIPWMIAITTLTMVTSLWTTGEVAANRFGYMKWMVPLNLLYAIALLFVTGFGYFTGVIPGCFSSFLETHNIRSLDTMLWWMTGLAVIKLIGCILSSGKAPHR